MRHKFTQAFDELAHLTLSFNQDTKLLLNQLSFSILVSFSFKITNFHL